MRESSTGRRADGSLCAADGGGGGRVVCARTEPSSRWFLLAVARFPALFLTLALELVSFPRLLSPTPARLRELRILNQRSVRYSIFFCCLWFTDGRGVGFFSRKGVIHLRSLIRFRRNRCRIKQTARRRVNKTHARVMPTAAPVDTV
jgi:hypothetical protein